MKRTREGRLRLLSAGAAQGLVASVAEHFRAETGLCIEGTYGAVGAIRERILAGEPCDAVILTAPLIAALEASAHVSQATTAPLGHVRTGIAVRSGDPVPPIADRAKLSKTLVDAAGLFFPDPDRATAGVHFMKVLRELAIAERVSSRLHAYPNGAAAMQALAGTTAPGFVGCTQITEIKYTPGVTLVGALPPGLELSTLYSVAVASAAQEGDGAREFVRRLSAPATRAVREDAGFE